MIEVKDLMWVVWCLLCCAFAYNIGHMLGFRKGLDVARAIVAKLIMEGKLDVPKQDQHADSIQKPIHTR